MKLLTVKQLCQELGVGRNTIHQWVLLGMPRIKIGGAVRFSRDSIEKWIMEKETRQGSSTKGKK